MILVVTDILGLGKNAQSTHQAVRYDPYAGEGEAPVEVRSCCPYLPENMEGKFLWLRVFWGYLPNLPGNFLRHAVDGRNPANLLMVGSLSHYLQGFIHPRWL